MKYKEEVEKYLPHLARSVLQEIFKINQTRPTQVSLDLERKRFASLKWLNLTGHQLVDAIKEGLQLTRLFLCEDNIGAAIKLKIEIVDNIFQTAFKKTHEGFGDFDFDSACREKQEHDRLFEAFKAHQNYSTLALNEFGGSSEPRSAGLSSSVNRSKAQLKTTSEDPAKEAIAKIHICLFGPQREKDFIIYNLKDIFTSRNEAKRAEELREIQKIWTPRLLNSLIEIYENHLEYSKP